MFCMEDQVHFTGMLELAPFRIFLPTSHAHIGKTEALAQRRAVPQVNGPLRQRTVVMTRFPARERSGQEDGRNIQKELRHPAQYFGSTGLPDLDCIHSHLGSWPLGQGAYGTGRPAGVGDWQPASRRSQRSQSRP